MRLLFCCYLLLITFVGCAPVDVQTRVSKTAVFTNFKTYSWLDTDSVAKSAVPITNPEVNNVVREAVDKSLEKKGYQRLDSGDVDFLVAWFGGVQKKVKTETINHFYDSSGYGTLAAAMPAKVGEAARTTEYEEGTILIDVLDPKSHKAIWRGVGKERLVQGLTESEARLYINRVVGQIVNNFPPDGK